MSRIELFNKLSEMETRKENYANMLKDISSSYTSEAYITLKMTSRDYNLKYGGESLNVDIPLITLYINAEISKLAYEIAQLIGEIK